MKNIIMMYDEYDCPYCNYYLLSRRIIYAMFRNIFVVDCESGDSRLRIFEPIGVKSITPFYIIWRKRLRMKVEDWEMLPFAIMESKDSSGNFIFFRKLNELMEGY